MAFDRGRRRIFLFLAAIATVILFMNVALLTGTDVQSKIKNIPIHIPGADKESPSGLDTPPDPEVRSSHTPYSLSQLLTVKLVTQIRLMETGQ